MFDTVRRSCKQGEDEDENEKEEEEEEENEEENAIKPACTTAP